jgi:hypothetical protein
MTAQRFAVEFDRSVVGVAVRVPGGFMFYSSDSDFDELEGRLFPRARAMSRRIAEVATAKGRPRFKRATPGGQAPIVLEPFQRQELNQ